MMTYIKHILLTGGLLFTVLFGHAQIQVEKSISEQFHAKASTTLNIENKYGDIWLNPWDKDSISININIQVTGKDRSKAQSKLDEVNFELAQTTQFITIHNLIEESSISSEFNRFSKSLGLGSSSVKININVKLPKDMILEVTNKYGNIYMDDFYGNTKFVLSNGKFKGHNLNGYNVFDLDFADASINHLESGSLKVNYGNINIRSGNKIRINSKTSDIDIYEMESLIIGSKRDKVAIRTIDALTIESNFTDFEIDELKKSIDATVAFGDLNILRIENSFEGGLFRTEACNSNIRFAPENNFSFEIYSTDSTIELPMDSKDVTQEKLRKQKETLKITGKIGETNDTKLQVISTSSQISILNTF